MALRIFSNFPYWTRYRNWQNLHLSFAAVSAGLLTFFAAFLGASRRSRSSVFTGCTLNKWLTALFRSLTLLVNYCGVTCNRKLNRKWAAGGLSRPAPPGPDLSHALPICHLIRVSRQQQHPPSASRLEWWWQGLMGPWEGCDTNCLATSWVLGALVAQWVEHTTDVTKIKVVGSNPS